MKKKNSRQKTLTRAMSLMITFVILVFSVMPAKVYAADPLTSKVPQLRVAVGGAGLYSSWKKVDGASCYDVYRSYNRLVGWKLLKKGVTGLSYHDKDVASGKRAYYRVRARKSNGTVSKYSKIVSGIIYRVYIETGHGTGIDGKWSPGCMWNGYQEAKLMIPICKSAAKYLQAKGVCVYTDAYNGNNRNLKWILKFIKQRNVSVLLNVHCDYRDAPSGTLPLYRYSKQKKLASCLNNSVHRYIKIRNRGLTKRTDLVCLNETKDDCVACIFETGSIKNDNRLLRTQYNVYGKALARGVCDYLGIEW